MERRGAVGGKAQNGSCVGSAGEDLAVGSRIGIDEGGRSVLGILHIPTTYCV